MYSDSQALANNLSKYEWKELSSGDDLNEILGHYRTANNDIVKSLLNLPSAVTTGEITVDWYPGSYTSNFGTQMLRWTKNGESTIFSRAKYGSSTKWGAWVEYVTKDDLTPAFTKVGSSYGLEAYHAAIGKLHILRLAGNVTSAFSNFNLALPDSCDGYFISEPGKVGDISYTIEINSKHLIVTPSTSVPVDKYFVHWLIYYGY